MIIDIPRILFRTNVNHLTRRLDLSSLAFVNEWTEIYKRNKTEKEKWDLYLKIKDKSFENLLNIKFRSFDTVRKTTLRVSSFLYLEKNDTGFFMNEF